MKKLVHKLNPSSKIRDEERIESLKEGGVEEARPYRDLTPDEQRSLEARFRNSLYIRNNFWWMLTLSILADLLFFYSIYLFLVEGKGGDLFMIGIFLFIVIVAAQAALFAIAAKENELYFDLRTQVFKLQGKAILQKDPHQKGLTVEVRKLVFSSEKQPELTHAIKQINLGDEIAVEYSPRTKHVWKIYKTIDI